MGALSSAHQFRNSGGKSGRLTWADIGTTTPAWGKRDGAPLQLHDEAHQRSPAAGKRSRQRRIEIFWPATRSWKDPSLRRQPRDDSTVLMEYRRVGWTEEFTAEWHWDCVHLGRQGGNQPPCHDPPARQTDRKATAAPAELPGPTLTRDEVASLSSQPACRVRSLDA